ncbi:MAG: hypothetical protein WCE38_13690 [Burkholderiales bacterium]
MDEQSSVQMLREGKITAEDLLRQTAAERVDSVTEMLLRHLPYDEVRRTLLERIGSAPRADYMILRTAYFKHCDHAPAIRLSEQA